MSRASAIRPTGLPRLLCAAALLCLGASACASAPRVAPEINVAAKSFTPSEGKARIYFVRPNTLPGAAIPLDALLDGRGLGTVTRGTYLMTEVDPGPHTISSHTLDNTDQDSFTAVAGQSYFFVIKPRWGVFIARVGIEPIGEVEGRAEVNKAKRVANAF